VTGRGPETVGDRRNAILGRGLIRHPPSARCQSVEPRVVVHGFGTQNVQARPPRTTIGMVTMCREGCLETKSTTFHRTAHADDPISSHPILIPHIDEILPRRYRRFRRHDIHETNRGHPERHSPPPGSSRTPKRCGSKGSRARPPRVWTSSRFKSASISYSRNGKRGKPVFARYEKSSTRSASTS
jgi:hypothetical protein